MPAADYTAAVHQTVAAAAQDAAPRLSTFPGYDEDDIDVETKTANELLASNAHEELGNRDALSAVQGAADVVVSAADDAASSEAVFLTERHIPTEVARPLNNDLEAPPLAIALPATFFDTEVPPSSELEAAAMQLEDPQNAGKLQVIEKSLAVLQQVVNDLTQATRRMVTARVARTEALASPY